MVDDTTDRRRFLTLVGSGSASLLAGCSSIQSRSTKSPTATPTLSPTPKPEPEPTETVTETDEETPTVGSAPLSGKTIRIGILAPQPESFPVGKSMRNGMQLAIQDINENGVHGEEPVGVVGATLKPEVGNTEASPRAARQEFIRLVKSEGCQATFGIFLTQTTLRVMESVAETETVHLTTGTVGAKPGRLVNQRYSDFKYHFRPGPLHTHTQAQAMLEFLEDNADQLGWESVAVLLENIGAFDPFESVLEGEVGQIVEEVPVFERTSSATTDWTAIFDEVESTGADVALVAQALTGTAAVKQWAEQNRTFALGGYHLPAQIHEFWEETNGACEEVFTAAMMTPQSANTQLTQPFVRRYRDMFDQQPIFTAATTYDAVKLYATAMARTVRENEMEEVPDSDQMVDALESITYESSVLYPSLSFTPKTADYAHEAAWSSTAETGVPVWQQWQTDRDINEDYGVMHIVAPEQSKTADFQQ